MFPPYWILIITRKSGNSRETQNQFESVAREFRVFHFIFFRFHLSFVQNCVEFAINCIASRVRLISCNPTTCRHCVGVTKLDSVDSRLSTTEYLRAAHRSASLRNENWIHGFSLQSYSWFGFLTVLLLCVHFGCGLLDLCDAKCQRRPSATQITTKRKLKRRRRRRRRVNKFCTFASSFLVNWVRLLCLCCRSLCLAYSRIHEGSLCVRLVNRNEPSETANATMLWKGWKSRNGSKVKTRKGIERVDVPCRQSTTKPLRKRSAGHECCLPISELPSASKRKRK